MVSPPPSSPQVARAAREAWLVMGVWAASLVWTISFSALYGYSSTEKPTLVLGVPFWVFWGIFVPWGVCTLVSWFVAAVLMGDEELTDDDAASRRETDREISP